MSILCIKGGNVMENKIKQKMLKGEAVIGTFFELGAVLQ